MKTVLTLATTLLALHATTNGVAATTEFSVDPPTCIQTGKHPAPACYQYYDCIYVMWYWEAQIVTCPDNQYFDINLKACALATLVDCQFRTPLPGLTTKSTTTSTTTTTTTTTTVAPTAAPGLPNCTGPGRHPALSCYDYYECVQEVTLWKPVLTTCVVGYAYDILIIACVPVAQCDCQNRLTTTTRSTTSTTSVAPPIIIGPPSCTGPGQHPAESCYDYYECEQQLLWWTPVLKNCVVGYAFDVFIIACVPVKQCDCQNRLTTTAHPTTSTTTLAPPIVIPPSCTGPGKHPALSCHDYYECEQELWWWKPVLKNCVVGYAYDILIIACVPVAQCDCQNRLTTTKPSTTSTTSLAPPIIGPPSCTGPGKHPAESCSDYYECEQELWWWQPVLKNCVIGYAFDIFIIACVPAKQCDCQNRVTTTISSTISTTLAPPLVIPPACSGPGKHPALSCYDYYECVQEAWWWTPVLKTCVVGYAFDIIYIACVPIKQCDCQNRLTTTVTSTTSTTTLAPPIVVPPSCLGPGKHPALSCYDYYECEQELWWWKPVLKNCVVGYAFDIFIIACVPVKQCDCQNRVTSTITPTTSTTSIAPPIIGPPSCTGPSKHPALSCYDYYECEQEFWWWKPVLKNCVVGYAFDIFIVACVPVKQCDCQNRVTSTVTPTTSTTSIAPPIIQPPSCTGPGKHPAQSCYDYYECEQELWWWKPVLKNCVIGYAFDIFIIACVPVKHCNCQNRVTTISHPTTSTTTLAPPIINPPSCPGPGRHPAPNCYQYYDCKQNVWWWEPVIETCTIGYAFDVFVLNCAPVHSVDCQHRITTTVPPHTPKPTRPPPIIEPSCSGPGKHPASSCYRYYECVQVWWWWEPRLLACNKGHAFDIAYSECRLLSYVDCHHRQTTTVRPPTTAVTPSPPPPPIVVPACYGPGRHPAHICYQYYECIQVGWWWAPELKSCSGGESFDVVLGVCYPSHAVDCQHRSTTTRAPKPTTAMTTPRPPPPIPKCHGYGKHPAPLCYQYYQCVQNWWWWEPELRTCPEGEGYDLRKGRCFCAEAIGCRVPVTEPKCSEPGKYPAHKCGQYYDCVPYFWWWRPELKDCPKGQGFARSVMRCVDKGYDCTLPGNDSSENSSKENGSKENGSKENGSKENGSKENGSKENSSKENTSKENSSKEVL